MKSIKTKLVLGILLINSLMLVGIIVFKFSFEDFYIKNVSKDLNTYGESVIELINSNKTEELYDYIEEYSLNENISIDIYNSDDTLVYTSQYLQGNNNQQGGRYGLSKGNKFQVIKEYNIQDKFISYVLKHNSQGVEFLATKDVGSNGDFYIICKTPISAIENSVEKASKFLFIIFIPIIILSIFIANWFSKRFTKPIIKLKEVSDSIANLNFDEEVKINTNDEIEMLSKSINTLSSKINESMELLKEKNNELEILINNKIKQEELRREFVSSISHELKTPITVISGYATGLKNNVIESETDKSFYIDVICEESEKMGTMVFELLDLYKLESKSFKLKEDKINIKELIEVVIKKHKLIFEGKEIKVIVDLEDGCILGDKLRVEQVLNNLLDNAVNHISGEKRIIVKSKEYKENIKISIFNTGDKIDEADLEKIWYSFVRLDKVRNSSQNRLGLGLAIVREIVNLHNGSCGIENMNDGVEFWIKIKKI